MSKFFTCHITTDCHFCDKTKMKRYSNCRGCQQVGCWTCLSKSKIDEHRRCGYCENEHRNKLEAEGKIPVDLKRQEREIEMWTEAELERADDFILLKKENPNDREIEDMKIYFDEHHSTLQEERHLNRCLFS